MPYSISTLLTRNLHEVFGENDPERRRAGIDEIFSEDCVFYDPRGARGARSAPKRTSQSSLARAAVPSGETADTTSTEARLTIPTTELLERRQDPDERPPARARAP